LNAAVHRPDAAKELPRMDARTRPTDLARMKNNAQRASDFLKALAHESRLLMLCILAEGEKSVGELEQELSLRQPTVSQQLARLRDDGLVSTRREGKTIYYSLASTEARVVIGAIYDVFCRKRRKR
jgi:ArsR family transcriptional regulator, virulence genes transcriptional regulator